jgi:hypothetical protein
LEHHVISLRYILITIGAADTDQAAMTKLGAAVLSFEYA